MKLHKKRHNDEAMIEDIAKISSWFIPSKILDQYGINENDIFDMFSDAAITSKSGEFVTDICNLVDNYRKGTDFETTIDK